MPIRLWCGACAALVLAQIVMLAALPARGPGAVAWGLLAYAALVLLAWIATDGRRPLLVTGAAMVLAALSFPAGAAAAAATGSILYWKTGARKPCVES